MARPSVSLNPSEVQSSAKVLAKSIQLAVACDLVGSQMSMSASRGTELVVTPLGVKMTSGKTGRVVLIPWPNIKGCELFPEA